MTSLKPLACAYLDSETRVLKDGFEVGPTASKKARECNLALRLGDILSRVCK